jgi:Protein of unknown function (DUF4236)
MIRFWRRVRVAPGLTLNLSKSGASVSLGRRGAHYTVGPRGQRVTAGLPGTGLFWTEKLSSHHPATKAAGAPPTAAGEAVPPPEHPSIGRSLWQLAGLLLWFAWQLAVWTFIIAGVTLGALTVIMGRRR